MNDLTAPLQRARAAVGGNSELARRLGVTSQAVSQWRHVPAKRAIDVERVTGIRREELRPDLYGEPVTGVVPIPIGPFSRFAHLRRTHFGSTEEVVEHVRSLRDEWDRR